MSRIGWNQVINEICFKIIPDKGDAGEVGRSRDKASLVTCSFLKPVDEYLEVHSANLSSFVSIWHFPLRKKKFKPPDKVEGT